MRAAGTAPHLSRPNPTPSLDLWPRPQWVEEEVGETEAQGVDLVLLVSVGPGWARPLETPCLPVGLRGLPDPPWHRHLPGTTVPP